MHSENQENIQYLCLLTENPLNFTDIISHYCSKASPVTVAIESSVRLSVSMPEILIVQSITQVMRGSGD